jgi:tetrapyrrole methylase family protein/MazG family protein
MGKFLCVLGSGIKTIAHITLETQEFLKNSDIVLFLVNEPLLKDYIKNLSKKHFDLEDVYYSTSSRSACYDKISMKIIEQFNNFDRVSVLFYGHPFYCSKPAIKAIDMAKKNGIGVISCSSISSLDCLFSDLYIDPAENGMQIFTADQFINENISPIKNSYLVILQSGFINFDEHVHLSKNSNIDLLINKISDIYSSECEVVIYESSIYSNIASRIEIKKISNINASDISPITTLVIYPFNGY